MAVDPWGSVVAQCGDWIPDFNNRNQDDGRFVLADIDLDWLEKVRAEMPLWEQRRGDMYPIL